MHAIRIKLSKKSVHNFVRIPYKDVNEKRPQRLPKRTPETRQIGYLEKAPKPHKMGAPGRRQQDLYERLVRGPSRNEGDNPWASRGNATPRETVRAYAMRVNGCWSSTWKKTATREAALATTPKTLEYFLRANGVNSVPALG